jgi:hypothetical protein
MIRGATATIILRLASRKLGAEVGTRAGISVYSHGNP